MRICLQSLGLAVTALWLAYGAGAHDSDSSSFSLRQAFFSGGGGSSASPGFSMRAAMAPPP